MESIKDIFRIGYGPSSSHAMGPSIAAYKFKLRYPEAKRFRVHLYGSLSLTGKGHQTDLAITKSLSPIDTEIIWHDDQSLPEHPNGLIFEALNATNTVIHSWRVFSTGGGSISDFSEKKDEGLSVYPLKDMNSIITFCQDNGIQLWEYVERYEGTAIWDHLSSVWAVMQSAINRGINNEGVLPGPLKLARKAASYYAKSKGYKGPVERRGMIYSYALAVAEENAAGGQVVTAPTCGSCGVLPAVLYLLHMNNEATDMKILRALATAGLIGTLVKNNASISGAEVGCQGEIGTACAMAAGAAAQIFGGTTTEIEYAAEMGMEHHLGLTCDPVAGLVQIPCIERNAFAAARALDACTFAILSDGRHRVSFDTIVKTMAETGRDLASAYKETSKGGLAKFH